jgi:acyl-CoA synthetase (AMP-forming)/AMP-acid ligase II
VPWSFDYGYGQLLSTIVLGISHIIPVPTNPSGICAAIERHRPTVLGGLPALYSYLLSGMSPIGTTDLSSLRLIMNTGGAIPSAVLRRLFETFGHCDVLLNYGLTETYRSCYLPPALARQRSGTIGIPIPGVDIVVVDPQGRVLPPGEEGELVHRGDYICHGYWNDPQATARAVRPDPLAPPGAPDPGRALYTGDYGYVDADGFVYFRGRRDHQIKSMGVRVSPQEVEELLHESGTLEEVAVFAMPHDLLGHEIWAAVVPREPGLDIQRDLMRYARRVMSQYMQPRRCLVLECLPRTTTGKIDYAALRRAAAELHASHPG